MRVPSELVKDSIEALCRKSPAWRKDGNDSLFFAVLHLMAACHLAGALARVRGNSLPDDADLLRYLNHLERLNWGGGVDQEGWWAEFDESSEPGCFKCTFFRGGVKNKRGGYVSRHVLRANLLGPAIALFGEDPKLLSGVFRLWKEGPIECGPMTAAFGPTEVFNKQFESVGKLFEADS